MWMGALQMRKKIGDNIFRKKLVVAFFVAIASFSCYSNVHAGKEKKSEIKKGLVKMNVEVLFRIESGRLFVGFLNVSNDLQVVSNYLIYGGLSGIENTVQMLFIDETGKEFPFKTRIRSSCPGKAEERLLYPGEFVGRSWPISEVIDDYGLTPGNKYKLKIKYLLPEICVKARERLSFVEGNLEWRDITIP